MTEWFTLGRDDRMTSFSWDDRMTSFGRDDTVGKMPLPFHAKAPSSKEKVARAIAAKKSSLMLSINQA